MVMLAGMLLLIPGFVTDIFGLLLVLPPVRDVAWRFLKGRIVVIGSESLAVSAAFAGPGALARQDDRSRSRTNISADPNRRTRPDSPWRRIESD